MDEDAHLVARSRIAIAKAREGRTLSEARAIHSEAGGAHGIAEPVAFTRAPIAILGHLTVKALDIVTTNARRAGRIDAGFGRRWAACFGDRRLCGQERT